MSKPGGGANDEALESGIHTDFSGSTTYGEYLRLESILSAQVPASDSHDELLFIICTRRRSFGSS